MPDAPLEQFRELAKFKERSYETLKNEHIPLLSSHPLQRPLIVLLGDSMFERMQTTGNSPSLHAWPSETMMSDIVLQILKTVHHPSGPGVYSRLEDVFNAGVGGDKLENILYRLLGASSTPGRSPLAGLLDVLKDRDVKVWVIHAGTNNLHQKKGLRDACLDKLRLILELLLKSSKYECRVLLTGLFYRKDISDRLIDEANAKIQSLEDSSDPAFAGRVSFLPAPAKVAKDSDLHMVDHVHLKGLGYRIWAEHLFPRVCELRVESAVAEPLRN